MQIKNSCVQLFNYDVRKIFQVQRLIYMTFKDGNVTKIFRLEGGGGDKHTVYGERGSASL